jgi:tripartite-type tricarboxylate transporter receptor subunit TctC
MANAAYRTRARRETVRHLAVALVALALTALAGGAYAEAWPTRPIRMVVLSAGGTGITDMMARLVAPHMSAGLGQQVVIDNRPGAGGNLAAEIVAKSPPDGYTLLMTNISMAVNLYLYSKLSYDPVEDFAPVSVVNAAPLLLLVHPSVPATSVTALVALAQASPGTLNYASGGIGSTPHLAGELFKSLARIDTVHIAYKSGPPAVNALVGNEVAYMFENLPATLPFARDGKLRALAVTSAQRSALAPDLPTMAEAGVPGYELIGWNGLMAPRGTPREIVARLHEQVALALRRPEMVQQFTTLGAEPVGNTPAEFAQFLAAEMSRWGAIIKEKGIRAD